MATFFEVSNHTEGVLNCSNVSSFAFKAGHKTGHKTSRQDNYKYEE